MLSHQQRGGRSQGRGPSEYSAGASDSGFKRTSTFHSNKHQGGSAYEARGAETSGRVKKSYEELVLMRASALKAMLLERGIPCQDCFDKESLARRILEKCS
jgi:hypothetical protein